MTITIKGNPKEIAALVFAVQAQQESKEKKGGCGLTAFQVDQLIARQAQRLATHDKAEASRK